MEIEAVCGTFKIKPGFPDVNHHGLHILPSLEASIVKLIIVCFEKPEVNKLDFILIRLIGQPKVSKTQHVDVFAIMSDFDLLKLKTELLLENKKTLNCINPTRD